MARTLADYRTEIAEHGFGDLPTITLDRAVNNAYEELVALERWPWLVRTYSGLLTPGQPIVTDVPSDYADAVSFTIDSQQQVLTPIELDEFRKRFVGHYTDQGLPYLYYAVGGGLPQVIKAAYVGNRGGGVQSIFATTVNLVTTSAVTAGNALVLCIGTDGATNPCSAIVSTALGLTFDIVQSEPATFPGLIMSYAVCPFGLPSGSTIQLTFPSQVSRVSWTAQEWSGFSPILPGQNAITSGTSATPSSPSVAGVNAGDAVIGAVAYAANSLNSDWTQGSGFTKENSLASAVPYISMWAEQQVPILGGSFQGNFSTTLSPAKWVAGVRTFAGTGALGDALLEVHPVPDAAYPYMLEYRRAPAPLVLTTDIPLMPARYQRLISFRALSYLHAQEDNPQMASYWENQFMENIGRMREEAWMLQSDRPNTILNVDDDDRYLGY